ncbi:MAG: potassium-transporting ATPase subunit KdpC [Candidatus Saganbacteria bacterium]|nr:potassium-transporting ATPase subunit KdpC [Candidatus Saganbacteria bacterium]
MKQFIAALKLFLITAVITGIIYPLIITAAAQIFFKDKANGSLVLLKGKTVGSDLIAQKFDNDRYFWPRPSAVDYNTLSSGGSNLSATSKQLKDQITEREKMILKADPAKPANEIPSDMLYASGSGLDPHISVSAAVFQTDRILKARKLDLSRKADLIVLINKMTEKRDLDLFGEERINVLKLNLTLDNEFEK